MKPIGLNSKGKMDWKGWAESSIEGDYAEIVCKDFYEADKIRKGAVRCLGDYGIYIETTVNDKSVTITRKPRKSILK